MGKSLLQSMGMMFLPCLRLERNRGKMKYIIGTRGSKLALTQAKTVCSKLAETYPEHTFEIQIVKTTGDLVLDKPLHEIGDKGVFVKEIEEKLLSGELHIGVHSMKDMPAAPATGLMFTRPWKREDPRDALILREKNSLEELPIGAVIGTGSKRREFQLMRLRPDLQVVGIRGNVDTRLRKMEEEKLDGILLAAAGLHRLSMQEKITQYLEPEELLPAPAQGILALEIREGEHTLQSMLDALSDEGTALAAEGERSFLQQMGGSCHVPVGALFQKEAGDSCKLMAMFGNESGTKQAYATVSCSIPAGHAAGEEQAYARELAKQAAKEIRQKMAGTVTLVGAGPGDPGLITVKGLRELRKADCIVYDRLAAPEFLEVAKPCCEKIYVGKASSSHTMKQEEINRLLVQKSMEYKKVVRLKGGDPYVFGRGGEEGLYLQEHGVPVQVVPGITSSIAGPAYAGIPITHRGKALGFHVVTAHDQNDALSDINFQAMAESKETCVFLMGLSKVGEIAAKLMEAGMPEDTGIAVVSNATTSRQKTCVSDLAHIAGEVERAGLVSPALIVAGEVVSLRESLNFFESRPLFGKRYLLPKIGPKPTKLKALLQKQGATVDEIQVGAIERVKWRFEVDRLSSPRQIVYIGEEKAYFYQDRGQEAACPGGEDAACGSGRPEEFPTENLAEADWLVFTSKNGVESFFENFWENGLDMRSLAEIQVAAIGGKTAESLETFGIYPDLTPHEFNSDALAEALKKVMLGIETVWYLKGGNADSHLKEALEGCCQCKELVVYENRPVALSLEGIAPIRDYDGVIFTCASSAERLAEAMGTGWGACKVYSIGPKTTVCLEKLGVTDVIEAGKSTYEGLAQCICR